MLREFLQDKNNPDSVRHVKSKRRGSAMEVTQDHEERLGKEMRSRT